MLLGFAGSLPMLFLSRIVAGIAGANISTAQAVIADITGPEGRARGMGVIGAAFGLGFILGPAFGGLLYEHFGPGAPGLAAAATSALALVLTWFLVLGASATVCFLIARTALRHGPKPWTKS
jgi:MFS family permease